MKRSLQTTLIPPPPSDLVAAFYRLPDRQNPFQLLHRATAIAEMLRRAASHSEPMQPDLELSDLETTLSVVTEELTETFSIFTEILKKVPAGYLAAA